MTTARATLTADDLFHMPDDHMRHELVRGELRTMAPAGGEHGFIAVRLATRIENHVEAHNLGYVFAAETGFQIGHNPDTVRAPGVAFIAAHRIQAGQLPRNFPRLAPDLVVEVVSPSDTATEVEEKVLDWLEAGTRTVWVAFPSTRSVHVYRSLQDVRVLTQDDALDGGDVLPGFTCPVRELFSR